MFDAIKKTLLAGVGAAVITKEKADEVIGDFVKRGKVNAADARDLARKLAEQGRVEFKAVTRDVEKQVRDLVSSNDAEARARIAELEARIAALERQRQPAARRRPRSGGASASRA